VSEEGQEFEKFSKKVVFLVSGGKNQISSFLSPLEKLLEKSTSGPPWKNSFRRPCTYKHLKYTIFVKNCVVLHHLAVTTLFNNTNTVSNP